MFPGVDKERRNHAANAISRAEGIVPSYLHFDYELIIANSIANTYKLPVAARPITSNISNTNNARVFMVGYSAIGGGHVVR